MKPRLLYPDRDLDLDAPLPPNAAALVQDLELDVVFDAMAGSDEQCRAVSKQVLLSSLTDPDVVAYRQGVLADCMADLDVARALHDLGTAAVERERRAFLRAFRPSPDLVLRRSTELLDAFLELFRRLRSITDQHASRFHSDGFGRFFRMVTTELDDEYLHSVADHVKELAFRDGVLLSAGLGTGNKAVDYVVRRPPRRGWRERLAERREGYLFQIPDRDESGAKALGDIRQRGLSAVAEAAGKAADHILGFFNALRIELSFYLGCIRLRDRLDERGLPICFPTVEAAGDPAYSARGVYDPALALTIDRPIVANDVDAAGVRLLMVTGANQGGKSTFLRSIGLTQLMAQAGMPVPATSLRTTPASGVFTHFEREEDTTMVHGKFDEELARMSAIVDAVRPGGLVLCNESFAATNEAEGSAVAGQVVRALIESGVRVVFVTHLYTLAQAFHREGRTDTHFLRAERLPDGTRTFRVVPGGPQPTSHGADLYRRIFGHPLEPARHVSS